jgi:hypothetical protein
LTFEALHAFVDFDKLPGGVIRDKEYPWPGWPMDSEGFLSHGMHECILLSRQLEEPVDFDEAAIDVFRRLYVGSDDENDHENEPENDHENDDPLVNIMVLGQSTSNERLGRYAVRRGIGMMLESVWNIFSPERRLIRLG